MNVVAQGVTTSVAFAVLAGGAVGPTVLSIARRTMLAPVRLRQVEVCAVAAMAGLLLGVVLARPPESMVMLLPLAVLGCAAAAVDAHEGRLPDALTVPLLAFTLLAGIVAADGSTLAATVISVIGGGAVALVMKATISAAVGWGDVKLVPTLAVVLVRHDAVVAGIVSVSVLVAVTAMVIGIGADRSTLVPYGPAMVVGTLGAAAL